MPPEIEIQSQFIELLKERIPSNLSMVDCVAETLKVSTDSAYRRIRGETTFIFEEVIQLSRRYGIPLDTLTGHSDYSITFDYNPIDNEKMTIKLFMEMVENDFKEIGTKQHVEVLYLARDMPIFYLYQFPEICAFKIYFWQMIYSDPEQKVQKFNPDKIDKKLVDVGKRIWDAFVQMPSTEIWGVASYDAILEQIDFLWESYLFENKEIALLLCDKTKQLVEHVNKQAELGCKFSYDKEIVQVKNNLKLYYTEFQLTHNKIMLNGDIKRVYISQSLDSLITTNQQFFDRNYQAIMNALKRSTLISEVGEKERNIFMNKCLHRIDQLRTKIENTEIE